MKKGRKSCVKAEILMYPFDLRIEKKKGFWKYFEMVGNDGNYEK